MRVCLRVTQRVWCVGVCVGVRELERVRVRLCVCACVSACLRDDDSIDDDDDDGGEGGDDDNNINGRYGILGRWPPTFVINNTARNLLVGNRSFPTPKTNM